MPLAGHCVPAAGMASCTSEPDWGSLLHVWKDGKGFLACQPSEVTPLMQIEHVQQLLKKTQKFLGPALQADHLQSKHVVERAVNTGTVALLAKLLHELQQSPSLDIISVNAKTPYKSVWYCVLESLCVIMETMQMRAKDKFIWVDEAKGTGTDEPLVCRFRDQLLEAEGQQGVGGAVHELLLNAVAQTCKHL